MGITIVSILILLIFLAIVFRVFNGDIVSPAFIFCFGFLLSFLDLLLSLRMWQTSISLQTGAIIILGAAIFTIVTVVVHMTSISLRNKTIKKNIYISQPNVLFNISSWKLILFFIFQLVVIHYMQKYVVLLTAPYGTNGSLSSAISMYQYLQKFTTLQINFPKPLTYAFVLSSSSCYVWGYVTIHNYYFSHKLNFWVLANLLVSLAGSFLTGSRGVAVQAVLALLVLYLMYYRDGGKKLNIWKVLIVPVILGVCVLASFRFLAGVLGRDDSLGIFEYISVYLGAPIKNLDTFLATPPSVGTSIWGYNTFAMQWRWLANAFNLHIPEAAINPNMQYLNGHNLGNVFTAYKNFIMDFGVGGSLLCIAMMSLIVSWLYERTKKIKVNKFTKIDWVKILYSYLVVSVGFTFFSDKFFESVTVTLLERIVTWGLIGLLFIKVDREENGDGFEDYPKG